MSQEHVEIVRRILGQWAAGEFSAGASDLDPHVMFVVRPPFVESGAVVGPEGIRDYMRHLLDHWERYAVEATELQAVGDTVLAHALQRGEGKASRIETEQQFFMLFTFRGRKIVRIESVLEEEQALDAAGLREQAMPQENVENVRQLFEHWERGDWGGGREFFDDSCEVVFSTSAFPDAGAYGVGRKALRAWMNFTEAFETFAVEVDQIVEAGDQVVVFNWIRGRGRASGADVDASVGAVFTLRNGKIVRYELTDRREALEAAGLRE